MDLPAYDLPTCAVCNCLAPRGHRCLENVITSAGARVEFWEIDGGPSGTWWETVAPAPEIDGSTSWNSTDAMLEAARRAVAQGFRVSFRTLAEFELLEAAGVSS